MQEAFVQVNGRQVRYATIGDKGPLVFILHGWPAKLESWQKVGSELALTGFQVVLPDWPGFGQSQEPPRPWQVKDYAQWLKAFIKEINTKYQILDTKYAIIGHSFGGRVAIQFAAIHPEAVSKLILVSAAGIRKKTLPIIKCLSCAGNFVFSLPLLRFFKPFFRKVFYRVVVGNTDYINSRGVMQETFKKVVQEDLSLVLSKIKAPTLLIWGEKDKKTPLEDAEKISLAISNRREGNPPPTQLVILKGAGHSPHKETPALVVNKILDFLRQK